MIIKKLRAILGKLLSNIEPHYFESLLGYSIVFNTFKDLKNSKIFSARELLWDYAIELSIDEFQDVTFIEFGVHEGYSLQYFSKNIKSKNSIFIGLDSFEGLPESWGVLPAGNFSTNKIAPRIGDDRVSFIEGWFQDTSSVLLNSIQGRSNLLVHFDADLYSSTLFTLTILDSLKKPYFAIFDEFHGGEDRALYNYIQAYYARVEFIGKTLNENKIPNQILCKISPKI